MNIQEQLIEKNRAHSRFKLEAAIIDKYKERLELVFIARPEVLDSLTFVEKGEFCQDVKQVVDTWLEVDIKFKKAFADKEHILAQTYDFLNIKYPSVIAGLDENMCDVDITPKLITVTLAFDEYMRDFVLDAAGIDKKVQEFLAGRYLEDVEVRVIKSPKQVNYTIAATDKSFIKGRDMAAVAELKRVTGKTILSSPKFIKNIKEEADGVVLCGKLRRFDKRVAKSSGNTYYVFELQDPTGHISCRLFPKNGGKKQNKFDELSGSAAEEVKSKGERAKKQVDLTEILKDNQEVVCHGRIVMDTYANDLTFLVFDLNICKIDYESFENKDDEQYLECDEDYRICFPDIYREQVQQDFLFEESKAPEYLAGKTFVVFDLETTGLDPQNDKIIEIAAIKIVDGKMTEVFNTFIDPEMPLPPKIVELTSITDDCLKGAPTIDKVFHDFVKFVLGAALVAHNIEFDMGFIRRAAKDLRYKIDNDIYDTLTMARKKHSVHNYKLATLCEHFSIPLTDAHRAIGDVKATAKLFVKLVD